MEDRRSGYTLEKVDWPFDLIPLSWGAESNLYISDYMGRKTVVKYRFAKRYMLPELAERLIKERTLTEAKALLIASERGVNVPLPLYVDIERGIIVMEFIEGLLLRDIILSMTKEELTRTANTLGLYVALLHNSDIIHGDLTTSNLIIREGELFIIDFGLTYFSHRPIDKASDLRVLERAIVSSHPGIFEAFFLPFIKSYREKVNGGEEIEREFFRLSTMGRYYKRRYIY